MPVRRARVVRDSLLAKGMTQDQNHHQMYRKRVDGVTTLVTRISHGATEIDDHNGIKMAKQCVLHLGEFWDLVDCPLDEAGWDQKVRDRCPDGRNPFIGH